MLKILHARLQHYTNQEFPDVQAGFRKGRGIREKIAHICWIIEIGNSRKTSTSVSLTIAVFDCVDHNKLWKALKEMEITDHLTCILRNLYVGQKATVENPVWKN